jgi:type III secretory pathway component EscU
VRVRWARRVGVTLLLLLTLALIAGSLLVLEHSSRVPLWERPYYWALSALLAIVASLLVYLLVLLLAVCAMARCGGSALKFY